MRICSLSNSYCNLTFFQPLSVLRLRGQVASQTNGMGRLCQTVCLTLLHAFLLHAYKYTTNFRATQGRNQRATIEQSLAFSHQHIWHFCLFFLARIEFIQIQNYPFLTIKHEGPFRHVHQLHSARSKSSEHGNKHRCQRSFRR